MAEKSDTTHCWKCGTAVLSAGGIGDYCPNRDCDVGDALDLDQAGIDRLNASIAKMGREFRLRAKINERLERLREHELEAVLASLSPSDPNRGAVG